MALTALVFLAVPRLLLALVPMRNPSARRLWTRHRPVRAILTSAFAACYGVQHAEVFASDAERPSGVMTSNAAEVYRNNDAIAPRWMPVVFAAMAVGPGAVAALLRLALSTLDRTPHYPPPPSYPRPRDRMTQQGFPATWETGKQGGLRRRSSPHHRHHGVLRPDKESGHLEREGVGIHPQASY